MPPQTPTPQATSTGNSQDPQAVALTKAIRQVESGGDPTKPGKSGEYGAYQFEPATWDKYSKEAGVNTPLQQSSLADQNKVAYTKIKQWKDQGYNPGQIASMWNAGEGKPNAYKEGYAGTNPEGVHYDTPGYAKKVYDIYQQNKGAQSTGPDASLNDPPADPQQHEDLLHKAIDFAFPVLSDIKNDATGGTKKNALQQLGDLGLSALWFAPGVGDLAEGALHGAGLAEGASKVLGQAAGGLGTGYAADVSSNLSQGKTGADAFTPGAGSVVGGALGGAVGKIGADLSDKGIVESAGKQNNTVLRQFKRGANDVDEAFSKNRNLGEFLAGKGVHLPSSYDPESVSFVTKPDAERLRNDASSITDSLTEALKNVPGQVDTSQMEALAVQKATESASDKITAQEREQMVHDMFDQVRSTYGDTLTPADLNELKKRAWNESRFDLTKPTDYRKVQRMIGNTLKTETEGLAAKAGLTGVKEANDYIGTHLDAADAIERIHGNKTKGGRLGDLMTKASMQGIGGVGGFLGGGPVGAIMGFLTGELAGPKVAAVLRRASSSPIKGAMIRKMVQEDPEVLQKILQYAKKTPQGKQAANEMVTHGSYIPNWVPFQAKGTPVPVPKRKPQFGGIMGSLITAGGASAAAQSQNK